MRRRTRPARPVSRFELALVIAVPLLALSGLTLAVDAAPPTCNASLIVESEPFKTEEDALTSLREEYSKADSGDAEAHAGDAEAHAAIAKAATDAQLAATAVDTRTYLVDDASGDRIVLREADGGGWLIDEVAVQVPQAVCETLAERARQEP